jgi:hypothetical protein
MCLKGNPRIAASLECRLLYLAGERINIPRKERAAEGAFQATREDNPSAANRIAADLREQRRRRRRQRHDLRARSIEPLSCRRLSSSVHAGHHEKEMIASRDGTKRSSRGCTRPFCR